MKLAQVDDPFGTIAPPTGVPTDPGVFIGGAIRIFLIVAGVVLMIYLLWGGLDWITSGGEKEKIVKAQQKITHAVIGIFIIIFALALFQLIAGDILKIIELTPGGWKINLPKIGP
ncbi:hypothetical protein A3C98_04690 [Candidatus Roizmanbacteria bacterium RIFCSPHIGHO2_02_FULL_37_15]|uniref:Uncharacterized protein n=1 Tax=Candidatus Roizmanbacteria bacterium RIFCSPLOWO2_01_FULL_37_16 TaxID=1802058 RepID=A0A1F7IN68_9BACT|nr:MAG: hypothetical protein A2859_02295 [Candidatus Roizmanbacteria bacterium RIFCSPHIGHO2_01_FULL_37_16b]OGK21550.1 MAG: hypothetical protein A3C98_04690 [Candidatus Roizmanbacteria bacterium RIFCSPHIGHO2_02_FULL_37_15]OGK33856.1 MAG: hypothetical protein A3F57_03005 [Candidatus Roizmanbacteria bacterium RIFCSPHIGHO2_12_FULL_36_11]OGK44815.1 MAG: hypothetical protein A3B40_05210 [Candidatus Roizmanbacteria bacterium RIFCSPLOWO2_01_FULL_37_16]OGK56475.1 MAG: hypothetical protein A3I50_04740 [C